MSMRPVTDFEARQVIYASLSPVWAFRFTPALPKFLQEAIAWADILEIPPVTRSWLYNQTLVAAYFLDRDRFRYRPRMNRKVFFARLAPADGGAGEAGEGAGLNAGPAGPETAASYRDFLVRELIIQEPS